MFIGIIDGSGLEPDNIADFVESARRTKPNKTSAFVGFISGVTQELDPATNSVSRGDTLAYSDDESSLGETESILPLFDEVLGGYSDDEFCPESYEPPRHATIFMAGNQNQPRYDALGNLVIDTSTSQNPAEVTLGQLSNDAGAATTALVAASSGRTGAQALTEMMTTLGTLLADPVTLENANTHNAEIMKCRE